MGTQGFSGPAHLATFVWERYIDELLSMDTTGDNGSDRFFFHCNANFSIYAATDEAGDVVERIQYDVFGRPDFQNPNGKSLDREESITDNPYLFQGRRWDAESKLYYYRNRYYDPGKGRFVSRDFSTEIWFSSNTNGNGYIFGGYNPLTFTDPSGARVMVLKRAVAMGHGRIDFFQEIAQGPIDVGGIWTNEIIDYYQENTWHCILIVEDACIPEWENEKISGWRGFHEGYTWDFHMNNKVYNPARDWKENKQTREPFQRRIDIDWVTHGNQHDHAAIRAAQNNNPSPKEYDIGGEGRFTCCSWVEKVLQDAGLGNQWEDPNPEPFGPQDTPWWVPAETIGEIVDTVR